MNARERLAARLQDRKGIGARPVPIDGPAPEQPPGPRRARTGGPRYSHSQHAQLRLEGQARAANRRAERAEAALAPVRMELETMRQRIVELKVKLRKAQRQRRSRAKTADIWAARNKKWPPLRLELETALRERPQRGVVSIRVLAKVVGVDPRLVFGWLHKEYSPNLQALALIEAWLENFKGDRK